jgi:hypothetical protein
LATDHAGWRWCPRAGPQGWGQSRTSAATNHSPMPHPRIRQSHGSNGDLPRVFTVDTLIVRQSLPSQDVRVSPLASIPAITGVIRPEEAGCSRGPADRPSGAQTPEGDAEAIIDGVRSRTILPFLILCPVPGFPVAFPWPIPPQGIVAGLCLQPPFDSREPSNSRACRTGCRCGWQSRMRWKTSLARSEWVEG